MKIDKLLEIAQFETQRLRPIIKTLYEVNVNLQIPTKRPYKYTRTMHALFSPTNNSKSFQFKVHPSPPVRGQRN